jgi:biopolymer transport protein TolR
LETLVPQPPKDHKEEQQNDRTIVVQVQSNGSAPATYKINETAFNKADIEPKLAEIFATRQEKVMFVKGDKDLDFSKVAEVIDFGHQALVDNIGLITPRVEAGQ